MPKKIDITILLLLLSILTVTASEQTFDIRTTFTGILDNREYSNSVSTDQTVFGSRIDLTLGYTIDSEHQLRAGAGYFQQFGSDFNQEPAYPLLYYKYSGPVTTFYMGSFPRNETVSFPRSLISDSLIYYRPAVQGTYFRAANHLISQNVWIDWVSFRTDTDPEHFIFGASGSLQYGGFFLDHYFKMFHKVGPLQPIPGQSIRDNGGAFVSAGYRKDELSVFDSLEIRCGYLVTLDRIRSGGNWNTPAGIVVAGRMYAFDFGLDFTAFRGEAQKILLGDPLYNTGSYGRIDLSYGRTVANGMVRYKYIQGIHFIHNSVDYSHVFYLTVAIGAELWNKD